jgi:predicted transcriptional regulator
MSYNNTRRLFALLVAVLVVCSFVAVPVAGASGGTSLGDSFDGSSSSTNSDSTDSDDEDSTDDTNDTDDTSSTEDTEYDSDGGDEDDGSDSSTDDDGDASSDDGDDENTTEKVRDVVDDTTDALDESTDTTTDTVDDTTDTVDDTVDGTTSTVGATAEDSVKTLSLGESLGSPTSTDPADVTTLQLSTEESLQFDGSDDDTSHSSVHETAAADADDADDGHAVAMATTNAGGGQPIPNAPAGGIAISFGLFAAMAALRTTPLVAGGVPSLGSIGASISTPAILSKLRPFVFPLRYSRYDDSDPLEHEAREDVYEIVNESPGSYLSEVSEEAGLPLSTTRHHIKVLEREDLVSGAKLRGKRRFYPAYAEGVELAAALNDEATAGIIDAIARLGSASVSDLADDIGRDPSTISHHLQRLEEDGIITREREGRAVMNKLSGEARTALEPDSTPKPGTAGSAIAGGAD